MTTKQIAERLTELCKKGDFEAAQKELFADNAVSNEPYATPEYEKETKGLAAILKKGEKFMSSVKEMHAMEVSAPLIAADSFACTMRMDLTMKEKGRMDMTELCVYEVKDGKIVSETFYM